MLSLKTTLLSLNIALAASFSGHALAQSASNGETTQVSDTQTLQAESLFHVYQLAVENDPTLKAAKASLRSQEEVANAARGLLLPQVGAEVSSADVKENSLAIAGDLDYNREGWQVQASQTLFDLSAWYQFQGSKQLSKQAQLDFTTSQQDLIARTIKAYLQVLRAYENLASSLAEEAAIKQQLDQTQQRFDVGLVPITDVHESQAAYDLAKVSRLTNEGALDVAYEGLSLLTGYQHYNIARVSEDLPIIKPVPADRDSWVQLAKDGNLQLQAALEATQGAQFAYKSAKAKHYPTITASIGKSDYDLSGDVSGSAGEFNTTNETLAVRLQVPIFTGGTVSANRRKALADYDRAREQMFGLERNVVQKVRAQHIALMTNIQQVAARKQSIVSAQSALEATEAGYNVGTRNIVDVLNVQRNLYSAQRDYANAKYDYLQSRVDLKQASGLLSPADIETINRWLVDEPATLNQALKSLDTDYKTKN